MVLLSCNYKEICVGIIILHSHPLTNFTVSLLILSLLFFFFVWLLSFFSLFFLCVFRIMEAIQEKNDDLLSLSLSIVSHSNHAETKVKRKRHDLSNPLIEEGRDQKIFQLLQERERMLSIGQRRKGVMQEGKGLHLIHLLLMSATLINENNISSAVNHLLELYRNVSVSGDSGQRVAAYFADGLTARLLTQNSSCYRMVMSKPTPAEEFIAFTHLYRVSPFYQFAHFTANQAIFEAFERQEENNNWALHVIDFDISHGFQWPSLIQSLSDKATASNHTLSFRITGFAKTLEELIETENRLVSFSGSFRNILFEFHGCLKGSELVNLKKRENETVAVNLVFHLSSLGDTLKVSDTLGAVHSLNPSIVVLVEREGTRNGSGFISRFMDSLHYYAALFDSLNDCLPLESPERLSIEKNHLGKEIKEAVAWEKDEMSCLRFEMMETWKKRMENRGFSGIRLSSKTTIQAKLLLKMGSYYCPQFEGDSEGSVDGFRVYERDDGEAISLGWQGRFLTTASAWRCV